MRSSLLAVLATAVAIVIVWVHGIHPLTLWPLAPVIVVLATALWHTRSRRSAEKDLGGVNAVMCLLVLCPTLLVHLAWHFDWAGTATASSTSALILLVAPGYALIVAGAVTAIAVLPARPRAGSTAARD